MMTSEELERRLAGLPVREPSEGRERALRAALRAEAGSVGRRGGRGVSGWWRRGVPLWQAVAACVACLLAGAWLQGAEKRGAAGSGAAGRPVIVKVRGDLFARGESRAALDTSGWRVLGGD